MNVYLDPTIPLTRHVRDEDGNPTGEAERVLFCRVGNKLLVHPDRWEEFCAAFNEDPSPRPRATGWG